MEIDNKKQDFEKIYSKEADAIFRYVISRVSNRQEAIDIVQDAFLKFWQAFIGERDIKNTRSFLFTITRNNIIDWYRKRKYLSLEALAESDEDSGTVEIPDEKSFNEIEISAEASLILKAMNKLSPKYKETIHLRFVGDLPPSEISEILGITPNAVSVRLNRGLEELRKILKINEKN
jgi:RNA polymerase sigma-70 factor, ECF subfamily